MTHDNIYKYKGKTYEPYFIDSLENHSVSVAKTVAPDFESSCATKEKTEFNLVAEEGFEPPTFGL